MFKKIVTKLKSLSMQNKMMLVFTVPIIAIYLILNTLSYSYINAKYEERLMTLVEQSQQQTISFIQSYMDTMKYLTDLIAHNAEVQEILSSDTFTGNRPYDTQYREYFKLNNTFLSYEVNNPIYRIGLYIPDEIMYSENQYFFYGKSRLRNRNDYKEMKEAFAKGRSFFGEELLKKQISDKSKTEYLSMFTEMYSNTVLPFEIGTVSVSIEKKEVQNVLSGAGFSEKGLAYIADQDGKAFVSSNDKLLSKLQKEKDFPGRGEKLQWKKLQLAGQEYYVMRKPISGIDWQLVSLIPVSEYQNQQRFLQVSQCVMIGMILCLVCGTAYLLSRYYVGRLTKLHQKMTSIQSGDLNVELPVAAEQSHDELEAVYKNFNFMVEEVRRLMHEHYQLGKDVKMSELRALQSQINPHFLYNTLDLINWMAIDYGATEIESMVWNLSRFYRLSLNHGNNILTIREELEHVQVYVNIENIHFDQAIHYHVNVPEMIMDKACLNIILQPFVENSILHGMNDHPDIHEIEIEIDAELDEDDVIFHVKDSGGGMSAQKIHELEEEYMQGGKKGYGVWNINFRIKLCYGEKYGVSYDSIPGTGTTAHIRIPLMDMKEAEEKLK